MEGVVADETEASEVETEDGDEDAGAAKKGGPMKLVLFAGLPALVLILGGAAAFLLMGGSKEEAHDEDGHEVHADAGEHGDGHDAHGKDAEHHGPPPAAEVVFYALPDLLVNIRSDDGRATYLKLKLTLEVDSEDTVYAIEPAMPRVMDRFQSFLRELRVEDLSGSAGSYRLRVELLRRVNLAVAPALVRDVLIEEMLIQ